MELPFALKTAIEEKCAAHPTADLIAAARNISERYRNESGHGKRLLTEDVEALSYAVVRMPATYGAVSTALTHTLDCFDAPIATVLDVGAGTGAATWAVREVLEGPLDITCLEREDAMIRLGSGLMAEDAALSQVRWVRHDLAVAPVSPKADLVITSYALNELSEDTRAEVLRNLWDCAEKLLVIIEPGTPVGFAQLREARETLIAKGGHVVAPCVHQGECPLPADDWCQFTARVARSRLHKLLKGGDVPYEDEKFSYLAMAKEQAHPAECRILRHPQKESGRIALRLCMQEGIQDKAVTKKQGELFKRARKADSGDAFPIV